MASHGGARNRSGPQADPDSQNSERRGLRLSTLPAEGYDGEIPPFPRKRVRARVREVWEELWRTPQAAAWVQESWRWPIIAKYADYSVKVDGLDAPAALVTAWIRLGDQIGMTPAGLRENGWTISPSPAQAEESTVEESATGRRLRAVPDAG